MQKQNLKPFNLEAALAGEPCCTRDGRKVDDIHYFKNSDREFKVFALVGKSVFSFKEDGSFTSVSHQEHENDIFMAPKTVTKWVNVYKALISNETYCGNHWDSEEDALKNRNENDLYIATVSIQFEL